MKVGIAGLGLMGSAIAIRFANMGHELSVYNRNEKRTERFAGKATICNSPKELADNCDIVLTVVTDFEAVNQILSGSNGIIESTNRDLIVADVSTISPAQSILCTETLEKVGIDMLGMPVMGGPALAEIGELVPIVAGKKEAFERAKPIIEKLGRIFYIGDIAGSANAIKLALNLNIALIAIAVSEGIALAKGSGIDPSIFVQILNSTYFKTGLSEKKGPKMANNEFTPSFHLKNMLKDLELANSAAQTVGITLPVTALAQQMFRAANNSGFSDLDYTSICAFLSKINGLEK